MEGWGADAAGEGATGSITQSPIKRTTQSVFDVDEDGAEALGGAYDTLSAMLADASDDCARRAASIRRSLRARFRGARLRQELAAARLAAQMERRGVLASLRRNFAPYRNGKRRRQPDPRPG